MDSAISRAIPSFLTRYHPPSALFFDEIPNEVGYLPVLWSSYRPIRCSRMDLDARFTHGGQIPEPARESHCSGAPPCQPNGHYITRVEMGSCLGNVV